MMKHACFLLMLTLFISAGGSADDNDNGADLSCFIDEVSLLANHPVVREQTLGYNERDIDVLSIERKWVDLKKSAPEVNSVLSNPATEVIQQYIKSHSIDGEGFLIGKNGGLVAATNKTSDFYQADELQYSETIKLAYGQAWIKKGIIDESAEAMLIKVAVPVFATNKENHGEANSTTNQKPKSENNDKPNRPATDAAALNRPKASSALNASSKKDTSVLLLNQKAEQAEQPIGVLVIGLNEFVISVAEACETFTSSEQETEQKPSKD